MRLLREAECFWRGSRACLLLLAQLDTVPVSGWAGRTATHLYSRNVVNDPNF